MKKIIFFSILSVLSIVFAAKDAYADTYFVGPNSELFVVANIENVSNPGSTIYNRGDQIRVTGSVQNVSPATQEITMSAITVGNTAIDMFPAPFFSNPLQILPGETKTARVGYFTVNVGADGDYTVDFTTEVRIADIRFKNTSLNIAMQDIAFDSINAMPFPSAGALDRVFSLGLPQIVSIPFTWNANATSGQHIQVTDTRGFKQCIDIWNGDPTPFDTFNGVYTDGGGQLTVEAADGTCSLLPPLVSIAAIPGTNVGGGNNVIYCTATAGSAIPAGMLANTVMQVTYTPFNSTGTLVENCGVTISEGNTSGENFFLANDAQVLDVCLQSSDMPVDPSVPRC